MLQRKTLSPSSKAENAPSPLVPGDVSTSQVYLLYKHPWGLPGGPVVKRLNTFRAKGAQSEFGELRSYTLCGTAKKKFFN